MWMLGTVFPRQLTKQRRGVLCSDQLDDCYHLEFIFFYAANEREKLYC